MTVTSMSAKALKTHLVGVHVSIGGGHDKGIRQAVDLGCEVAQVFTKNNMQWFAPPLADSAVEVYRQAKEESGLASVFGHAGYLINLAATKPENLEKSRESLLRELVRADQLELPFLVLHPGAHLGAGEEAGLRLILQSLDWVFERHQGNCRIAMEATAGQGTCLGARIEHLATLLNECPNPERLAVCLDTCHLFAAGFDLRTRADIDRFIDDFTKLIPWEQVVCVHLNDSKGALGSRLDRHELLGEGKIGWGCFQEIVNHPAFADIPLCLETPKGKDNGNDRTMLAKLKAARNGGRG